MLMPPPTNTDAPMKQPVSSPVPAKEEAVKEQAEEE
jgi:hypothetical protein